MIRNDMTWKRLGAAMAAAGLLAASAAHAEKWDLPMAYGRQQTTTPRTARHSPEGGRRRHRRGALEIVRPRRRLTVQGQRDQARDPDGAGAPSASGCSPRTQNENAVFGFDSVPLPRDFVRGFREALAGGASHHGEDPGRPEPRAPVRRALAPAGDVLQARDQRRGGHGGHQVPGLQRGPRRASPSWRGMLPVQDRGGGAHPGPGRRESRKPSSSSGSTGYDRKVWEHLSHFYEVNAWLPRNYVFRQPGCLGGPGREHAQHRAGHGHARGAGGAPRRRSSSPTGTWPQLAANGMTVQVAGEQLRGDLEAIGATMTEEWLGIAGDDGKAIVDTFAGM